MDLDPKKLSRFEKWCDERYADRSTRKFVADARTMAKYNGVPPKARKKISRLRDFRLVWDIWEAWGGGGVFPVARPVVPDQTKLRGGRRAREPKRLNEAISFAKSDYLALIKTAEASPDLTDHVLVVVARSGLRISDVLRANVGDLRKAMKREDGILTIVVKSEKTSVYSVRGGGKAEAAWRRILDHEDVKRAPATWHVASAMMGDPDAKAEAGFGAYERVRRRIERLGEELGISGRVHLHRLRRTVGVGLARKNASLDEIAKALVHSSVQATRGYIDEARAEESAMLLRRLEE
jgi:integrase